MMKYQYLIQQKRTLHANPTIEEYSTAYGIALAELTGDAPADNPSAGTDEEPRTAAQPAAGQNSAPQPEHESGQNSASGSPFRFAEGADSPKTAHSGPAADTGAGGRKGRSAWPFVAVILLILVAAPVVLRNHLPSSSVSGVTSQTAGGGSTTATESSSGADEDSDDAYNAGQAGDSLAEAASEEDADAAQTGESAAENDSLSESPSGGKTDAAQNAAGAAALIDLGSFTPEELLLLGDASFFGAVPAGASGGTDANGNSSAGTNTAADSDSAAAPADGSFASALEYAAANPDLSAAANYYKNAAEQGSAAAQLLVSDMYLFGIGVEKDLVDAMRYFNLAAGQSFDGAAGYFERTEAMANQVLDDRLTDASSGKTSDAAENDETAGGVSDAAKTDEAAGDVSAQRSALAAGRIYLQGLMYACGSDRDYDKAAGYFAQVAAGDRRAAFHLAIYKYRGVEIEEDEERAELLMNQVYSSGDLAGAILHENESYYVANLLAHSTGFELMPEWDVIQIVGGPTNVFWLNNIYLAEEALELTGLSAIFMTEEELTEAGVSSQAGEVFIRNMEEMSEGGDAFASLSLGMTSEAKARGGEDQTLAASDTEDAIAYYALALQQGDGEILTAAGNQLLNLDSKKQSVYRTALERSAKQGDLVAIREYCAYSSVSGHTGDISEYLQVLKEAGTLYSQFCLGRFYREGIGVEKDFAEAAACFRRSVKQGLPQEIADYYTEEMEAFEPVQGFWSTVSSVGDIYYFHNDDCDIYVKTSDAVANGTMDYTFSETRACTIEELNNEEWGHGIKVVFEGNDTQYWLFDTDPDLLECHWEPDGYSGSASLLRQEDLTLDDLNIK